MEMWMVPKNGGPPVPAHLPSLQTIVELSPQSVACWFEWFRAVDIRKNIVMDSKFGCLADPAPILPQKRPSYILNEKGVKLDIFVVSNALYIGTMQSSYVSRKDQSNRNEILRIKATPLTETMFSRKVMKFVTQNTTTQEDWNEIHSSGGIDAPTTFMVWNTRGVSRPMFETNMIHLRKNHYPHVMLLTETKISKKQVQNIHQSLQYINAYHCVEPVGVSRGMVLLWNSSWYDFYNIDKDDEQPTSTLNGIVQVANERSNPPPSY